MRGLKMENCQNKILGWAKLIRSNILHMGKVWFTEASNLHRVHRLQTEPRFNSNFPVFSTLNGIYLLVVDKNDFSDSSRIHPTNSPHSACFIPKRNCLLVQTMYNLYRLKLSYIISIKRNKSLEPQALNKTSAILTFCQAL